MPATTLPNGVLDSPGRALNIHELRARESALELLRGYFAASGLVLAGYEELCRNGQAGVQW